MEISFISGRSRYIGLFKNEILGMEIFISVMRWWKRILLVLSIFLVFIVGLIYDK